MLGLLMIAMFAGCQHGAGPPPAPQPGAGTSRAAWWMLRDDVKPIAELVNSAEPGTRPAFKDQVGRFKVKIRDRAIVLTGVFPRATVWRFDVCTFDGQHDIRMGYVPYSKCAYPDPNSVLTKRFAALLGDKEKALTHTGPWEFFGWKWLTGTARVALDGKHIYTSWFDASSLEDEATGRLYASFALEILEPGKHTVRIAFEDFEHNTRWWPGASRRGGEQPEVTKDANWLRPHNIGSVAIGEDERVRDLEDIRLKPELVGKHPRLAASQVNAERFKQRRKKQKSDEPLGIKDVARQIDFVHPRRGRTWELNMDEESMQSDNDMDAGRKAAQASQEYDALVSFLTPEAKEAWEAAFRQRLQDFYTYFIFQRNYNATGYAQNHCSAAVRGIVRAGLVWDGPEAEKWLRWGVMTCRRRVKCLGTDGGLEYMNEGRGYGLGFWEQSRQPILEATGVDIAQGEFFRNEWRYALHNSVFFPTEGERKPGGPLPGTPPPKDKRKIRRSPNVPIPAEFTPENTPVNYHFGDVDQVYMREDWSPDAFRVRLWAGSVFGKTGRDFAMRYNWAHCRVNAGSFILSKGPHEIIHEAGKTRTYRKAAGNNNCILVNDTEQWGGGRVWHPKLEPEQITRIAFFADGALLAATRADLKNAYPPKAKVEALSRCLVQLKPNHFLVFDRVATTGKGKAEWRFHAAYTDPMTPSDRFTAFSFKRSTSKFREPAEATYEKVNPKVEDVSCQVAFLSPAVKATIAFTDAYYRWGFHARPTRHMKVVQEGEGPLTLLTAFAPEFKLERRGENAFVGADGDVEWTVLVGGGEAGGLASNAHFAVAAHHKKTGATELMRFGGSELSYNGVAVASDAADVFAVLDNGKLKSVQTTIPEEPRTTE